MSNTPPPPAPGSDHARATRGTLDRAIQLVRFLRANCRWDAEQTASSLIPHLLEESAEVAHAIQEGDDTELEGELGDLLLNLAFQIVVAEEKGTLDAESVTARLEAKMRRRHPHLYGDGPQRSWESIKAAERTEAAQEASDGGDPAGVLSGMPRSLDALTRAFRIQDRVAGVGFDWEDVRGALAKVEEELAEVRAEVDRERDPEGTPTSPPSGALREEVGDLLFAAVNAARLAGVHPTLALAGANRKFTARFEAIEALARAENIRLEDATLEELDALWERVKAAERSGAEED